MSNGYHNVTYTVTSGACSTTFTKTVRIVNGSSNLQSSVNAQLVFNSAVEKNRIKLEWFNNTGDKNDYFIVQKMDETGAFVNMEFVKQEANTKNQDLNFFKAYDAQPNVGENTYRIHTVFTDGNFIDSDIKTVNFIDLGAAQISPNPATDFININLENYIGKPVELSLVNQFGQLVKSQIIEEVQTAVFNMDISTAQSGLYILQIASKGKRDAVVKFVVSQ